MHSSPMSKYEKYVSWWCMIWIQQQTWLRRRRKMSEKSIFSKVNKSDIWGWWSIGELENNIETCFYMCMSSYICVCKLLKMRTTAIHACNDELECVTASPALKHVHTTHEVFFSKYFEKKRRDWAHFRCMITKINMQMNFSKMRYAPMQQRKNELKNRWWNEMWSVWLCSMVFMFTDMWEVLDIDNNEFHA